jgi:hypothetical protein
MWGSAEAWLPDEGKTERDIRRCIKRYLGSGDGP